MHQETRLFGIVFYIYLNLHLARCAARTRAKAGVGVVVRLVLGGGQHGGLTYDGTQWVIEQMDE
jgi:hypothetical protein